MIVMSVPHQPLLLALMIVILELAAASHFRGAIIQWKPVDPVNFDGRILVTHRIAWRTDFSSETFCNASIVSAGTLIGEFGEITCRSGCSGSLGSTKFQCTDFSVDENWSAGQGSNEINMTSVENFEASYASCCWITVVQAGGSADWEVRVKGSLSPRTDNGKINSSPITAEFPVFRLRQGAIHTISIPVSDADGDIVRCRWSNISQGECNGVCQGFPATLDEDNCRLTYNDSGYANYTLGWYAVAIQVEDFISASSTVAMSSVPLQFLVLVQNITIPPGVTAPTFVGTTPANGACITVGSTYQQQITARSGGDNASIADISTVSPPGLFRSALTVINSRESYINVTWTPSASQQGASIFCYTATDNFGLTSSQRCITLVVGVAAPQLMNVMLTSFGNGTFSLSLEYDQQIARPTVSSFIHVYQDDGVEVLSVDVSTFTDAVYSGTSLNISAGTAFSTSRMYYLLADSGIAVVTAFCAIESAPVDESSEWVFRVIITDPQNRFRCNDTIIGDPLYEVPVIVDEEGKKLSLCYEVRGQANQHFNLISDTCVSVNALYSPMNNQSIGNIISKVGVLAEDNSRMCQQIEADLDGCTVHVNGGVVTMYNQDGIRVMRWTNRIRISVPNCENVDLVMWMICEVRRGQPMMKFVVARGFNLRPTSHGLIGQFWNIKVEAEKYNVTAEDKIAPGPDHYAVTVNAPGNTRRFFAWKYPLTWDRDNMNCLYSGNAQGGMLYEVSSLSDPVIQGTYKEYIVSGLFSSEYKYEMFHPQCL